MTPRVFHKTRTLVLVTALAGLAAQSAQAQLFGGDDQARQAILNLRQEVGEVRAEGQRGRIQLASQIEELQRQLGQLRGQIETLSKQVADSQQAQRDMYLDMSERQQRQPGSPDAAGLLSANADEQAAYDSAIDLFRNGDYKGAIQALRDFVTQYPKSGFAPTAQFYLGSSHYALKDYKNAIDQLQTMIKSWPDNQRAPDALLVIAGSQIELGNHSGARSTLQRITQQYPGTPAANTARDRLQLLQ